MERPTQNESNSNFIQGKGLETDWPSLFLLMTIGFLWLIPKYKPYLLDTI